MRSFLLASLAALAALAFPACTQDITGGPGTGDDQGAAVCGDSIVQMGEACDDGNTTSGDGCSATCQSESASAPRVDVTVDKPTVATELGKTEAVTLSVTSANGFTGTVNIAATAAAPGVTFTIPATVELTDGQTATVPVMAIVATNATGADIADALTFTLTSSAGTSTATTTANIAAVFTIDYIDGTGTAAANHVTAGGSYTVKKGAILRFKNDDNSVAAPQHVIHADGAFTAQHEDPRALSTTQPVGSTYEITTAALAAGANGMIGCHNHTADTYASYTVE